MIFHSMISNIVVPGMSICPQMMYIVECVCVCRSTDMWGLGCLMWEVFSGSLTQVSALKNTAKVPLFISNMWWS